jgi:hypothetical protein
MWCRRRKNRKRRTVKARINEHAGPYTAPSVLGVSIRGPTKNGTVVSVGSWEGISLINKRFVRRISRTLEKWISSQHWRWSTTVDLFLKRSYRMMQLESYNKQSVMFRNIPQRHSYIRLFTTQHTRASACTEAWGCGQHFIGRTYHNITRRVRKQNNYWLLLLNTIKSTRGPLKWPEGCKKSPVSHPLCQLIDRCTTSLGWDAYSLW